MSHTILLGYRRNKCIIINMYLRGCPTEIIEGRLVVATLPAEPVSSWAIFRECNFSCVIPDNGPQVTCCSIAT